MNSHVFNLGEMLRDFLCVSFPKPPSLPGKKFMSAESYHILGERNKYKKLLTIKRKQFRQAQLREAFIRLAGHSCGALGYQKSSVSIFVHVSALEYAYVQYIKWVKWSVDRDKKEYYNGIAKEAADAFEANDSRAFYFHVKRLLPHKAANHPLRTFKGKVAQNPLEGRMFCQEHFASLTCAKITSPASLVSCSHLSHTTAKRKSVLTERQKFKLHEHMILKFAELNPHKACGEDIIPNALLKKYPRQFADMFLE